MRQLICFQYPPCINDGEKKKIVIKELVKGLERDFNMSTDIANRNGLSPTESNPMIAAMLRNTLELTF